MIRPRLIRTFLASGRAVRVHKLDASEYRCRLFEGGLPVPEADYFTDDLDDAEGTALLMLEGVSALA